MNFISMILEVAGPNSGVTPLNINSSMNSSLNGSVMMNENACKMGISSPEIIKFICEKMFELYLSNPVEKISNTLIPGFFHRLYENLNKFHFPSLTTAIRSIPYKYIEQVIDKHLHLEQAARCIQSILIVPIGNMGMGSMMSYSQSFAQGSTIPYELKFKIMNNFFSKIKRQENMPSNKESNENLWLSI